MKIFLLGVALLMASAAVASASECPLLQAQIDKEYGRRFDRSAAGVRNTAAQAWALHRAGKHDDAEKKYDEAAKMGGVKLMHKKK